MKQTGYSFSLKVSQSQSTHGVWMYPASQHKNTFTASFKKQKTNPEQNKTDIFLHNKSEWDVF